MTLSPTNVATLTKLWQRQLPDIVDGAPVFQPTVMTATGTKNLLFVTTKLGHLLALDAQTGALIWRSKDVAGPNFTTSSPAIDASGRYVYSYALDGKVHRYATATGKETINKTWPVLVTHMPAVEKGSSSLNIAHGYLYMAIAGYPGDGGHYEGHLVAVQLKTGTTTVFNAVCSNIAHVLGPNECPDVQAAIWGRAAPVVDAAGDVFITTGNGPFRGDGRSFGDSIVKLSPNLTRVLDSYTPVKFAQLQAGDLDLGSAVPALLPRQKNSLTPSLMVQAGKDSTLRLINRQNLSGQGGPNHAGGAIQALTLPVAGAVVSQPAVWTDTQGGTWVFVTNAGGLFAYQVVTDAQHHTTLRLAYQNRNGGSSPFLANGVLFVQGNGVIRAMNPAARGAVLWSSTQASAGGTVGELHWQSPIVVNGTVYAADNNGRMTAYGLPHA